MNTRTLLLVAAVVVALGPGLAFAAVTGSPDLDAQFTDSRLAPGEQSTLDVVLVNEGDLQSASRTNPSLNGQVTTARGLQVSVAGGDGPFSIVTGTQAVGSLPEGGATQPISFGVVVDRNADPGRYQVPVTVEYSYTSYISEGDGSRNRDTATERLLVPVRVEDSARVDVADVNSSARVGASEPVSITVENGGSIAANDATFTLATTSGDVTLGQSESATRYVESWEPGERRTLRYDVTATGDAEPGEYGFTLTAEYDEESGRQRTTSPVSVSVPTAPEQSFALESVSSNLSVGDDGEVTGRLVNGANRTVENVVLQWASQQGTVTATESEYALGALGPNASERFAFDVEVGESARSGPRQFTFAVDYEDESGDEHTTAGIDVRQPVGPETDRFDVRIDADRIGAGGSAAIDVTVRNAGETNVSDVTAKLFAESPISTSDSEAYVQALAPGESTNVTFGIAAAGSALEKTYPLSLDFRYDEPDGDTVTSDTYRVPVSVTSGDGGGAPVALIGAVALLAVLGVGAALRYT